MLGLLLEKKLSNAEKKDYFLFFSFICESVYSFIYIILRIYLCRDIFLYFILFVHRNVFVEVDILKYSMNAVHLNVILRKFEYISGLSG